MMHNARWGSNAEQGRGKEAGMLRDLAALTPPLAVCCAFLIGVVLFLRRQMGAEDRPADVDGETGIHDDGSNTDTSDPQAASSLGRGKA
jgi:hypothetical protein